MLLRNLTKVWISEFEEVIDHGENKKDGSIKVDSQ